MTKDVVNSLELRRRIVVVAITLDLYRSPTYFIYYNNISISTDYYFVNSNDFFSHLD